MRKYWWKVNSKSVRVIESSSYRRFELSGLYCNFATYSKWSVTDLLIWLRLVCVLTLQKPKLNWLGRVGNSANKPLVYSGASSFYFHNDSTTPLKRNSEPNPPPYAVMDLEASECCILRAKWENRRSAGSDVNNYMR